MGKRSSWHAVLFVLVEAALVGADIAFGKDVALSSAYVVPLLPLALVGGHRTVVAGAVAAFALALASGVLHDITLARHAVRLTIVAAGGAAAVAFTVVRERLREEVADQRRLARANDQLVGDLHDRERELAGVVEAIADAVLVHDESGRSLYANQAAADVLGMPDAQAILDAAPGEIPGRFAFTGEDGRPVDPDLLPGRRIFAGDAHPEDLVLRSVDRDTGREIWTVTKATAVRGPDGRPVLAVNVIEDVTDARRRAASTGLLAEAGDVLGASLDLQTTLDRVVALVVPRLADWCSVDLPDGRGVTVAAVAHVDPAMEATARAMLERYPAQLGEEYGVAAVLRGEPSFVRSDLTPERLAAYARDPEHLQALVASGLRHLMIVGMRAGGGTIGALSFVRGRGRAGFTEEEVRLAEELARRAGTAVLNARLFQERTEVADTLQRSLLPPELPRPGGLAMAAHYRAIGRASEVGGDFYDAFPLPDGWLVAIGDVTGKGAAAAALTGLARSALEAVATLTGRPALALAHLHGLLARRGDMALVSASALHFHAGGEPLRASVFCAGHPAPLLLRGGEVTPILARGPLLGAFGDQEWLPLEVDLEVGDVIVLRTDGVTDSMGVDGRLGEERLQAALLGSAPGDAEAVVATVRALVENHQAGEVRDDVAVLAVAVTGPQIGLPPSDGGVAMPSLAVAVTLDGTAASVPRARAVVDEHLTGVLPETTLEDVRLMVSELASNAVKHAGGDAYVLAVDLDPHRLRVELADNGPGPVAGAGSSDRSRGALPEGGYGLGIVDRLASRWGIERGDGPTPTRVWFELSRT